MIVDEFCGLLAKRLCDIKDVRSYRGWIEIVNVDDIPGHKLTRVEKIPHPVLPPVYAMLAELIKEKRLETGTIGLELGTIAAYDYEILKKQNPKVNFVDAEDIFIDLRRIKSEGEIQTLKMAAELTEKGLQGMIQGSPLGLTAWDLNLKFKKSLLEAVPRDLAPTMAFRSFSMTAGPPFNNVDGKI